MRGKLFSRNYNTENVLAPILDALMTTSQDNHKFVYSVILNFVDFSLNEVTISEKTQAKLLYFWLPFYQKDSYQFYARALTIIFTTYFLF